MDLEKLKLELTQNTYSEDPQIASEELNAKTITSYVEIVSGKVRGYLISIGKLFDIDAASKDPSHPAKDLALGLMMTLQPMGGVDFSEPANIEALNGLAFYFGLSDEDKEKILKMGEIKISKAEQLGLGRVRAGDIERARSL